MPATMTVKTDEYAELWLKHGWLISFWPNGDTFVFRGPSAIGDFTPLAEAREVWAEWGGDDEQFTACVDHVKSLR